MDYASITISIWHDEDNKVDHAVTIYGLTMTTRQATLIRAAIRKLYAVVGEVMVDGDDEVELGKVGPG